MVSWVKQSGLKKKDCSLETFKEEKKMLRIVFEYCDQYSYPKWNRQECTVSSVEECKRIYGLGVDCEYRIISVEKI